MRFFGKAGLAIPFVGDATETTLLSSSVSSWTAELARVARRGVDVFLSCLLELVDTLNTTEEDLPRRGVDLREPAMVDEIIAKEAVDYSEMEAHLVAVVVVSIDIDKKGECSRMWWAMGTRRFGGEIAHAQIYYPFPVSQSVSSDAASLSLFLFHFPWPLLLVRLQKERRGKYAYLTRVRCRPKPRTAQKARRDGPTCMNVTR